MLHATILLLVARLVISLRDEKLHEKYLTMNRLEFLKHFNDQNFTWKVAGHDSARKNIEDIDRKENETLNIEANDRYLGDPPENFDASKRWSQCATIAEIYNQKDCDASFAFAAANTASDRTCIDLGIHVHLAEQDLECQKKDVCSGGIATKALQFWVDEGLVSQDCKPFNIPELRENVCRQECYDGRNYRRDKHRGESFTVLDKNDEAIKLELYNRGPIIATFALYSDFRDYESGIYSYKYGKRLGDHSVRVIGYGVENGEKYWLIANSWGRNWGMNGRAKIKRRTADLDFEKYMISLMPKD